MNKIYFLLTLSVFFISCQRDKIDLQLRNDLSFNPDLQIPLVNAKLRVSDLVQEDSTLIIDPNDQSINVVYLEDNLFEFAVIDFVNIPRQTPTNLTLVENGLPSISLNVGLGTLGGAELKKAQFKTGYLVYSINTGQVINDAVTLDMSIKNAYASTPTDTFKTAFTLPANITTITDSVDISGLTFDLSNAGTTFNFFSLFVGIADTSVTPDNQPLDLAINFAGLTIDVAEGYFGTRPINIPNGQFDFDLGGLEEFTNGLRFTNPSLTLIATSNVGIDIELAPKFDGVNSANEAQGLGFSAQIIAAVNDPNVPVESRILVNKDNSQIIDFLANIPNQVLYSGKAILNPGVTDANNFITDDARVKLGMQVDIPLEFSAQNMMLEQRISDINLTVGDSAGLIESLTLFFNNKNGFPFELNLSLSFIDSVSGDSINGVTIPLLEPAPTDMNGVVTSKTERQFSVPFGDEEIESLTRVNAIVIRGRLNTPDDGSESVKLLSSYSLQTIISARTKLNVNLGIE